MELKLTKPILFFDLETTGIDVAKDHIIELSYIKIFPDGSEECDTLRFRPVDALGRTVHIPEASTEIHGIKDEDVEDLYTFGELAEELYNEVFVGCDLAGFASNKMDIPLLVEEFLRAGINYNMDGVRSIDVQGIFFKMEKRNLEAAYKFYCDKELANAHSAEADTMATYEVLKAQLDRYSELENDVDFLSDFSNQNKTADLAGRIGINENGQEYFTFGKHKGQLVEDIVRRDPGFISWVMQGNFTLNTKQVLQRLTLKYKNKK